MDIIDKIVREWGYEVPNGIIDMQNSYHIVLLEGVLDKYNLTRNQKTTLLNSLRGLKEADLVKNKESGNVYDVDQHNPDTQDLIKKDASPEDIKKAKEDPGADTDSDGSDETKEHFKQIYNDVKKAREILKHKDKYPEGSKERQLALDTHQYAREIEDAEIEGRDPIPRDSAIWKEVSATSIASNNRIQRIATDPDATDEQKQRDVEALRQKGESFDLYNPLKKSLIINGYGSEVEVRDDKTGEVIRMKSEDILKRFVNEFQNITEKLSTEDKKIFSKYLQNPTLEFDPSNVGNFFEQAKGTGIPPTILDAIMRHTTQDAGKKGVGMGEFALAMLFKNVKNANSKGDLALIVRQPDGTVVEKPFELKGQGATLGAKPEVFKSTPDTLNAFGVKDTGAKFSIVINGEEKAYSKNQTSQLLADKWNSLKTDDEREQFKKIFKRMIVNDGHGVGSKVSTADAPWEDIQNGVDLYDAFMNEPGLGIDFSNPDSIGSAIGLMNYVGYAISDEHTEFAAHDMGAADKKISQKHGINTGEYVRAGTNHPDGTRAAAFDMAKQLKDNCIGFERVSFYNIRPRVGLGTHTGVDGRLTFTRPPECGSN